MLKATIKIISYFFLLLNCSESITDSNTNPGRRDYTWIVDTIKSYDPIYRVWGSSPSDIWAVTGGGDLSHSFFHFDGDTWTTDGEFRSVSPSSIWGFSKNNIFVGGSSGKIWHYNGESWKQQTQLSKNGITDIIFNNMWGLSPKELYAFGGYPNERGYYYYSVIAYYNGMWNLLNTEGLAGVIKRFFRSDLNNKFFIGSYLIGGGEFPDSTLIFEYFKGKYRKLYSNLWVKGLQSDLSYIDGEVYFVLGNEIAKFKDNQFETFIHVENPLFYQQIWGRNSKDIFLFMTDGLAHYNGDNIEYLFNFKYLRTYIIGASLFNKDAFFIIYQTQTNLSLCYHGILDN